MFEGVKTLTFKKYKLYQISQFQRVLYKNSLCSKRIIPMIFFLWQRNRGPSAVFNYEMKKLKKYRFAHKYI